MNKIVQVLMERDNMSQIAAEKRVQEVRDIVYDAMEEGYSYNDVEEILADELGLEMDYLMDLV